jgi:hypothetical protein
MYLLAVRAGQFPTVLARKCFWDITSFSDGPLYLGGWDAVPYPLPEGADEVNPQQDEIDAMVELARQYPHFEPVDDLEIFDAGRCYRPRASPKRPILAKVD